MIARIGVRPQLSLVVLIAILPLLAVLLVGVIKNRQLIFQAATTRAQDLARLGAERQDDGFQDAKTVLSMLRRLPQVTAASPENCHAALQAIGREYPQFTSIGVADAKGMVTCMSLPAKLLAFRDTDLFRIAMAAPPSAFVVGKFLIGPITGKPIVVAATPLRASAGDETPTGIAYVSLDLDRAAQHAWDFATAKDATLSLIDSRAATILARSSGQLRLAGTTLTGSPLVSAMLAHPDGGSVEAVDVDGTSRIFGFAPLIAGGGSGLMVAVGLSRATVMADADWRLMMGVVVALFTALIAAGAAWLFADRTQFGAIRSLVETAKKLGAGDLAARADMAAWQAPEFRALGKTLGDMADGIAVAQEKLSASERQLRLLAANATDLILLIGGDGQRLYASPACRTLLGFEPEEMLRISSKEAIHPEDVGVLDNRFKWSNGAPTIATYRMRRKDGGYVWVEAVSREIAVEAGQPRQRVVVVRDIDLRVAAERRLKESEMRYRFLAENGADMVFQYDRDLVRQYVSPACREILGYEPEDLIGKRAFGTTHPDDAERVAQVFQSVLSGQSERAVVANRMRHPNGNWIWIEAQLRTMRDEQTGAPSGVIGSMRDISVRKAAEDQLEEANRRLEALAGQDGLTGLANRRTFDDALAREHRRALRDKTRLAMIMIDVDWFKSFNDRYGHPAGDECLKQVSRAIKNTLPRPGDIVARYGGEEFAVLLPNTDESGAMIMADRIRRAVLALAIEHDASPAKVATISAGVGAWAPNALDIGLEVLMQDADRALYRAKNDGRNAIVCASALGGASATGRPSAA
ncbi:diguanylate cyclase [Methylocapsa sp. S129]|uniref:diguanylate cyclase n=1 Tax=Methylocapsa sp. S129 TaxID=1641869 RepID=UPI00131C6B21|nr:diguanylate cyclase [Methylocapsa sp. S129]